MKKLVIHLLLLSLFCFFFIKLADMGATWVFAMQVRAVVARDGNTQYQLDSQAEEIKEIRIAQEKYAETQNSIRIDNAEIKAKFSIVYAILALIGGTILTQVIQRYAGERRK